MPVSTITDSGPDHLRGLLRHFADLRDGVHGDGAVSRQAKEALIADAVELLDGVARQALAEINDVLLLRSGAVAATGLRRSTDGDATAAWLLSWPEQRDSGLQPVTLEAFFGRRFHHPHLRGATVGNWPLNVFNPADAEAQLPTLRAIAAADLHNLVFQSDYRIVPAVLRS